MLLPLVSDGGTYSYHPSMQAGQIVFAIRRNVFRGLRSINMRHHQVQWFRPELEGDRTARSFRKIH